MSNLAKKFRDDVVIIGISDETRKAYDNGMRKLNMSNGNFEYSLALDPKGKMIKAVKVTGIPHIMIISSDWIVRWQGHPMELEESTLRQIVAANKTLGSATSAGGVSGRSNRWALELQ